jgi:hypothetical protein
MTIIKRSKPNSIIAALIKDAEDNSIKLSSILLKTKTAAKKLSLSELYKFASSELDGSFYEEQLPKYRIRFASPVGFYKNKFTGQVQEVNLNMDDLCKQLGFEPEFFYKQHLRYSVTEIENCIEKSELSEIRITFTPGQLRLAQESSNEPGPWFLIDAYFKMSLSIFPDILSNIRSTLLDHLVEAEIQTISSTDNQKLFLKGKSFDAAVAFLEIIKSAKQSIILIDNFLSDITLKFFADVDKSVTILLITQPKSKTASFELLLENFAKQYRSIDIKTTQDFHDRFLVIDNKEYFHLGASIKDAGNKVFMYTKITDPSFQRSIDNIIMTIK